MIGMGRRAFLRAAAAMVLAVPAHAEEDEAVRAAFARWRAVTAARDGAAAAELVTERSRAYLSQLQDMALAAPRSTIETLPPADLLMVLRLRHEFTADELRPLSGGELIRISVEEAWSSPKVLAPLTVGAVDLAGEIASLWVERAGEPVPIRLLFRREQGAWKLDLVALARGSDAALAETLVFRAARARVPMEEVLRWAIEDTSGHLVDKDLWAPLERGVE
jgi:hypothetical protein